MDIIPVFILVSLAMTSPGNEKLVGYLQDIGALRTPEIVSAFKKIDRVHFVLSHLRWQAYDDYPLPISGKATISQPYTVAVMMEWLQPQKGEKILSARVPDEQQLCLLISFDHSDSSLVRK